jgi:hypothetical protein
MHKHHGRRASSVLAALALLAAGGCGTPSGAATDGSGGGSSDGGGPGTDAGSPATTTEVSGSLTASGTWSDGILLTGDTTIEAGVTITVSPGTEIHGNTGVRLFVNGTLDVQGTDAQNVTFAAAAGAPTWAGIRVEAGGTLSMTYTTATTTQNVVLCDTGAVSCDLDHIRFFGVSKAFEYRAPGTVSFASIQDIDDGGVAVAPGGDVTITDSYIWASSADLVKTSGGSFSIDHCEIGSSATYQHGLIHIGAATTATITNNTLVGGVYAFMIGNTAGTAVNYNNIVDNDTRVLNLGGVTNVDMRFNYWDTGAPSLGASYDTSSPAAAPYTDVGPR